MKLPITDKFLWEVFNIANEASGILKQATRYPSMSRVMFDQDPIFERYRKQRNAKNFAKLIYYLKRKNLIKIENLEGKKAIILTKRGIDKALKASFKMEKMQKRKDGKWVMLIFDIPERRRKLRDLLREILQNLGFKLYQKSVWISPYDVSEKVERAVQTYSLDEFVKVFLIEEV